MGSKPIGGHIASIAQLAVRGTYNAEVMGSSPIIRIVVGSDLKWHQINLIGLNG